MQERKGQKVIGFGRAVSHFDVVGRGAGINRGQAFAQRNRPIGLAVPQRRIENGFHIQAHLGQLAQADGAHAALAHIHLDDVLPRRLHPLHLEGFDFQLRLLS